MKTTNIISTPNIEGNIGSCTVQSNEAKISQTLFTQTYSSVQINSCTGQVITQASYTDKSGLIGLWIAGGFFGIVIIIGIIAAIGSFISNH